MSIRKLSRIFYPATGVLLLLLIVFGVLLFRGQRELVRAHEVRYASYLLADELRQSSDDMTRMARTFAITGDLMFERMYWDTLAIRNGELPRPRHYNRSYWDLVAGASSFRPEHEGVWVSLQAMKENVGFTTEEFAKLAEAEDQSNDLVQIELGALNAMRGLFPDAAGYFNVAGEPDPALAIRILHDDDYHRAKAAAMKSLNDFYELLDTRTGTAVASAEYRANRYLTAVLFLLGLIVLFLAFSYVIVRKAQGAEDALWESRRRTSMIVETAMDAVVTMDARGLISGWNAKAAEMFGWSPEEAIGRRMSETIIPPQHREAHERGLETFLATGDGSRRSHPALQRVRCGVVPEVKSGLLLRIRQRRAGAKDPFAARPTFSTGC